MKNGARVIAIEAAQPPQGSVPSEGEICDVNGQGFGASPGSAAAVIQAVWARMVEHYVKSFRFDTITGTLYAGINSSISQSVMIYFTCNFI